MRAGMQVGLTGGIGSGKSTVAELLRERGAVVIDSDALAREVVEPGTPGLAAVVEAFGDDVLAEDGSLDRAALAKRVFVDEGFRRRLQDILHPLIRARSAEIAGAAPAGALVVHDIPLLVETGQADRFDVVLVVDVPVETQVERMVRDRGWTREDAEARVRAQAGRDERLAVATYVLDNTGTRDDLRERVTEVVDRLVSAGG
jgi:dephospho-CoA kinase